MSELNWNFRLAGTYAGISSFADESGESRHYLKVDYFGGKCSTEVSADYAERLAKSHKIGEECRAVGDVLLSGGTVRPRLTSIAFSGDDGWRELTMEDMVEGMTFSGFAQITRRKKSDGGFCSINYLAMGGTFVSVGVPPDSFESFAEGRVILSGVITSEITSGYDKESHKVSNNVVTRLAVKGCKPFKVSRR